VLVGIWLVSRDTDAAIFAFLLIDCDVSLCFPSLRWGDCDTIMAAVEHVRFRTSLVEIYFLTFSFAMSILPRQGGQSSILMRSFLLSPCLPKHCK
jgi:hypothetical protein